MIVCPECGTRHLLVLARGKKLRCRALKADKTICSQVLTHRNRVVNDRKYDQISFRAPRVNLKPRTFVLHVGRSRAAPPIVRWPCPNMSEHVQYVRNPKTHPVWTNPGPADIRLPFKHLDVTTIGLQGLIIDFMPLSRTPSARAHFDAITTAMTTPRKGQDITEAVGEAAAAMAAMALHRGFEMLWGFDVHSGAGIDQIWWNNDSRSPCYLVVEAKGPNAGLSSGALGNPRGYGQMEPLWVIDRLGRMRGGAGAAVADQILRDLALRIIVAHPSFGGGIKSYYGCVPDKGKQRIGTLVGLTVTARWQADGMLGYTFKRHKYNFQ